MIHRTGKNSKIIKKKRSNEKEHKKLINAKKKSGFKLSI